MLLENIVLGGWEMGDGTNKARTQDSGISRFHVHVVDGSQGTGTIYVYSFQSTAHPDLSPHDPPLSPSAMLL